MSLPRRNFLRDGLRSGLSIGLLLTGARIGFGQKAGKGRVTTTVEDRSDVPIEAQRDPVFLFKQSTFEPYIGGIFQAPGARGQMVELELLSVNPYIPSDRALKLTKRTRLSESFSLVFKASDRLPIFTSIHTITHPALGEFNLFLTTRNGDNGALLYEAVINHIR